MIKRTLRVNDYLYNQLRLMAKYYNMSINQLIVELIQLGILERNKQDIRFKQWRNK